MHIALKSTVGEKTERSRNFDGVVKAPSGNIWLAYGGDARVGSANKLPLHCGKRDRLVTRDHLGLLVATRKRNNQRGKQPNQSSSSKIECSLRAMEPTQSVKGSHSSYDKRSGHKRCRLIMGELNESPRIQEVCAQAVDTKRPVRFDPVTDGMLHESIGDEDEKTRKPTAECDSHSSQKVIALAESLLAPDQRADERTFEEEREHAFHRQRLPDHTAGVSRESGPIRSELKFHGNAGDDADGEIDTEHLGPKTDGFVVFFITGSQGAPFPVHQKPSETHRELRKQIVINQRETKLEPTPKRRIRQVRVHSRTSTSHEVCESKVQKRNLSG